MASIQDALAQHDLQGAEDRLLELYASEPDNHEILLYLANVALLQEDREGAVAWLKRLPELSGPSAPRLLFQAGQLAMRASHARMTREFLERSLLLNPQTSVARNLLIHVELVLARWQAMREQVVLLDKMGQATATDVFMFCIGKSVMWSDDEPIHWLERCLHNDPEDEVVRAALVWQLVSKLRRDEARQLLQDVSGAARSNRPEAWRITLAIAEDSIYRYQYGEAASLLKTLPPEADLLPRTWLARGTTWRELGDIDSAVKAFSNAAALDPFDPEPVTANAQLLKQQSKDRDAEACEERARLLRKLMRILVDEFMWEWENKGKPPASTVARLGSVLMELGEWREAEICFESLLTDASHYAPARESLERIHRSAGPKDEYLSTSAELQAVQMAEPSPP